MGVNETKPWMVWTGRVLSAIPVLMMVLSGSMKLSHNAGVVQGFGQFGFPESLIMPIGLIEVACAAIYLLPQTAVLGAVLVAGYFGGAMITHIRIGQTAVAAAPFLLGVFAWAGLWLREPRLRPLLPFR